MTIDLFTIDDKKFDIYRIIEDKRYSDKKYGNKYQEIYDKSNEMNDNGKTLDEISEYFIKEYEKIRTLKIFDKSLIPERYKCCTFENYKTDSEIQKKALQQAKNFVELLNNGICEGKNLIIVGNNQTGTGKTRLGYTIYNECKIRYINILQTNVIDMYDYIKINFENNKNSLDKNINKIEEYKNCDVLFIDDIGKEKVTPWTNQTMYSIINKRYEDKKTTIITIETDIKQLKEHYGESGKAIIERLIDNCEIIILDGENYRHKR